VESDASASPLAPVASPPGQGRPRALALGIRVLRLFLYQRELTPFLVTLGLFLFFVVHNGSTFTGSYSLSGASADAGPIAAIGIGEVLLLVLGEIDLSAGQVFLFCPWMVYWMHNDGLPIVPAIAVALLAVCVVGAINGLITVRFNVPSFVTTLATNFILYGVVLTQSNDQQATMPLNSQTNFGAQFMGAWKWSEILWVVVFTGIFAVVLTRTRFGVRVIATGGNLVGAAEAGVPVRRVKVWCFVLCSFLAGLIGIVDAVQYGTLDPGNFGVDYILYAIGACVIGGTALTGGRGTVVGAFIGAILIGILQDGLTLNNISTNALFIYLGVIIIIAVGVNVQFDRLIARSRSK
jgi:simple sugar transport system permease protein